MFKYSKDGNLRFYFWNEVAKTCPNHNGKDFVKPNSVIASKVEKLSDPPKLPSENTPSNMIITELFKKGTEPTETSTKYKKLNPPTSLFVKESENSVTLTWAAATDLKYVEEGVFGYYVYFDNKEIGFTTETSYTINNLSTYKGTYSIKAGYKDTKDCLSDPVNYKLEDKKEYSLTINGNKNTTYTIGNAVDTNLYNGSMVKLLENGVDVTSKANISIKITDGSNQVITSIPTDKADTYKVTYTVTYGSYTNTCYNEITFQ